MNPISPIKQISQLIKNKMTQDAINKIKPGQIKQPETQNEIFHSGTSSDLSKAELKRTIIESLLALSDEERTGAKGTEVLVEHILSWNFGGKLSEGPKKQQIIDEVAHTITNNKDIQSGALRLISDLTENK